MRKYRCFVGNVEQHPLVLAFNVDATSEEEARRKAAERCLLITEEREGARLADWGDFADARLYHVGEMTIEEIMAVTSAELEG